MNNFHLPERYRMQVCTLLQQYIPHARVLGDLRDTFTESNLPIMVQILDWDAIPESFQEEINTCYVELQTGVTGE
jgi:hypothetical protein